MANSARNNSIAEYPQVLLRGRARRHEGNWLVSLFLVNAQPRPSTLPDSAWLFQVRLVLTGPDGGPVFLPRPDTTSGGDQADKAEQRRLAMAYRACPEFAVGHGTGVHVTPADGDPMRAVEIATAAVPSYEIPFTDAPRPGSDADLPWLDDLVLDMKRLAELDLPDLVTALTPLDGRVRRMDRPAGGADRGSCESPHRVHAGRCRCAGRCAARGGPH